MRIRFCVLGPVSAEDADGRPVALRGPMHRAVLGRLLVARGRSVPVTDLVDDLWVSPPAQAISAVRTFVAALRRSIEPGRPARTPARLLVTRGTGYALLAAPEQVDAWRFERAVRPDAPLGELDEALGWWRGPAYADFPDAAWPRADRARLTELRLRAVELRAEALLGLDRPADAVPGLDEHVTAHPWREAGWRLLALALYRTGRQGDALDVLRRARELLAGQLGVEPGVELRTLEIDILRQEPHLDRAAGSVFTHAASAYERLVPSGSRKRLESAVGLLRNLAVTGADGLEVARGQRAAAVRAAEQLGDPELTARVIGAYDVPAIWTRADDPAESAAIVAAAARALAVLPAGGHLATRARLLATVAVESRGTRDPWPLECARQAESIARELDDPGLLAFALNGTFMQSCHQAGNSHRRDAIGAELVAVAARHGLVTAEVLGHLVRLQASCATLRFAAADEHAAAADRLAERHELPLVTVFTQWYRALRDDVTGTATDDPYRTVGELLDHAGMPGLQAGLRPLASLGWRSRLGLPPVEEGDFGPYGTWARLVTSPGGTPLADVPAPPADLLAEAMWWLLARAATEAGDQAALARARTALAPASSEWAGAASGLLTLGRIADC